MRGGPEGSECNFVRGPGAAAEILQHLQNPTGQPTVFPNSVSIQDDKRGIKREGVDTPQAFWQHYCQGIKENRSDLQSLGKSTQNTCCGGA